MGFNCPTSVELIEIFRFLSGFIGVYQVFSYEFLLNLNRIIYASLCYLFKHGFGSYMKTMN